MRGHHTQCLFVEIVGELIRPSSLDILGLLADRPSLDPVFVIFVGSSLVYRYWQTAFDLE